MKTKYIVFISALAAFARLNASAQTAAAPEGHQNLAIIPISRMGEITNRQSFVVERAKSAPGNYDVEFIGDSITELWETTGSNVWKNLGDQYTIINMGVSGDCTEHVLWRFGQGQLHGIKAKVAVIMIGTNNSRKDQHGVDVNTDSDILAGISAVVNQIRVRQPDTKILLLGIFPRGQTFNPQRGRLLQINQALARLDDSEHILYLDFGSQYIGNDGSISQNIMPDYLHPNEAGYKIWADAIRPKLKELLQH